MPSNLGKTAGKMGPSPVTSLTVLFPKLHVTFCFQLLSSSPSIMLAFQKHSVSLKMFSDLPADSRAFTFDVGIKLSSSTNWHLVGEDLSLLSTHILKSSSELHRKLSFYGLILGISTLIHTSREYSYQLHMLNDLVLQSKI